MNECPRLVFVVGIGRSGTSLVQSILASHSQIISPPETAFLRRYVISGRIDQELRDSGPEAVVALLRADKNVQRLELDAAELTQSEDARKNCHNGRSMYLRLISRYADLQSASIVCDKDPRLVEHLRQIVELFPDAFVLHVIRDPRDVLTSKKTAAWSRRRHPLLHIAAAEAQWQLARRCQALLSPSKYLEVRYEDLLSDPHGKIRVTCDWLGIPYEPDMLSFNQAAASLVSDDERQWKKETLEPLKRDNAGNWKSALSTFEIAATQAGNRPILRYAGYDTAEFPAGAMTGAVIAGTACGWMMRVCAKLYVWRRVLSKGRAHA